MRWSTLSLSTYPLSQLLGLKFSFKIFIALLLCGILGDTAILKVSPPTPPFLFMALKEVVEIIRETPKKYTSFLTMVIQKQL